MRVPLGVIAMIYESRPNVTIDAAALAIKSGNAVILRGGHEAIETNRALAAVVSEALADAALPADAVQLIPTTDRAAVGELIRARDYVDVLIPRGGKGPHLSPHGRSYGTDDQSTLTAFATPMWMPVLIWKWRLALLIMPRPNAHLPAMPRKHSWFIAMKRSRFCR